MLLYVLCVVTNATPRKKYFHTTSLVETLKMVHFICKITRIHAFRYVSLFITHRIILTFVSLYIKKIIEIFQQGKICELFVKHTNFVFLVFPLKWHWLRIIWIPPPWRTHTPRCKWVCFSSNFVLVVVRVCVVCVVVSCE